MLWCRLYLCIYKVQRKKCGPGNSVGIATELRAGRCGDRIPVGTRFSASIQTGPGAHPASCTMGTGSFPVVKSSRGVTLTTVEIYLYSPMGRTVFTEPQCLYSTAIPLLPLWAIGLYRTSVHVQYSYNSTAPMGRTVCTEPQCLYSTATPVLPLWAVQVVQSLSACTVELYLYSPQCLYSTAIPLLPSVPVQGCTLTYRFYWMINKS